MAELLCWIALDFTGALRKVSIYYSLNKEILLFRVPTRAEQVIKAFSCKLKQ